MINQVHTAEQQFLKRLTDIIKANLHNEHFGVNELARELGMSRTTVHRKVKSVINKPVTEFIRETRLKHANELLLQKTGTISEIAYKVGFGSVTYFTKCFHDYYGYPPGEAESRDYIEKLNLENQSIEIQPKQGRKKILIVGVFVIAIITILFVVFLVKPINTKTKTLPKTIAVLPFINDSQDSLNTIIINGILEGIIGNLSKIQDLAVKSRTSVEQYRNNKTKSVKQIAKELGVAYIVEGSGQIHDNQIKLHVQLIDAKSDKHIFSKTYDDNNEDIFTLESEIATLVANEIEAVITPDEKDRIDAKPTKSIQAYNLVQQALSMYSDNPERNRIFKLEAEERIRKAITIDSTYSDAYVQLGWNLYGQGKTNDTILHLVNRALNFDPKNSNAFYLKGFYFIWVSPNPDEAEDALKRSIQYNPSHSSGYSFLGDLMFVKGDYPRLVENKLKAIKLVTGTTRTNLLYYFSFQLYSLGFFKEGLKFSEEIIENYGDSSFYYLGLEAENMNSGNYKAAYKNCLKSGRTDNLDDWWCRANVLCFLRDFKKTLKIVDNLDINGGSNIKFFKKDGQIIPNHYIGFTYLKNGLKEKADFHFEGVIKTQQDIIRQNTGKARGYAYYTLVCTYSAMGDKAKAVENMKKMLEHKDEIPNSPVTMLEFRNHPMFDIIQDTPEHKEILKIAEERFQHVKKNIENQFQEFYN